MKKNIACIISLLLSFIICFINTAEASVIVLTYWFSDSQYVGTWENGVPKIYSKKLNNNGSFAFLYAIDQGCSQWQNALGTTVSYSYLDSYSGSDIKFYGGTASEINATGQITYVSGTNGLTNYTFSTTTDPLYYYGIYKHLRKFFTATGYIADNGTTLEHQRETGAHELGHALGWCGHSPDSSDVMYATRAYTYTLTFRDKNHLSQVY